MDKYKPMKVLGEGSFGKVYLMRHIKRRELCCVKVMKIKNLPKKERENCRTEVELMKRLIHPNIVHYRESFLSKNKDSLCICMEYCDGGDLSTKIEKQRSRLLSESFILNYFVQMTLGLHYMHSNRVLHRDLKTQNIFLLGNGRLVLGDLGISKVMEGTQDFARTCIGTPYYMSPEIFKNKPYNHKSDIWALGCVLYEMTTLNHAFDANSLNGLASKIIKGKYPPIHPNFSANLRSLISAMLSVSPASRPDLEMILQKPFIKRHVQRFFGDIASRNQASLGTGTAVLAKVGSSMAQGVSDQAVTGDDKEVRSLVVQLEGLKMKNLIVKAVGSTEPANLEVLKDEKVAKRKEREQSEALKREQERKANVEAALQRLRAERAARQEQRKQIHVRPQANISKYAAQANKAKAKPIPSWNNQKYKPPDLAKMRQNDIMKSAAQRREREKEDEKRKERVRQREEEERNRKAKEDKKKRMAVLEARKKRQQEELEEWERQQRILADEEARRHRLAVAAENARRKQQEENDRKKAADREVRKAAFEQLRKDKERLDKAAEKKRQKEEAGEKMREEEETMKRAADGGIAPQNLAGNNSEAKFDDDDTDNNDETKAARRDEDPPPSPISELPVVFSSLDTSMKANNNNLSGTSNSKSSFSATGAAKALIKDPFARAESEVRAKAALQKAKHASENVIGALSKINNRFNDDNGEGRVVGDGEGRGGGPPVEMVEYSSSSESFDDSDSGDDSDVDMMLLRRENASYDSSDEEEEDKAIEKRAMQLENELTMVTARVEELKQTLQQTKNATQQAIKQGILTPVKSRPVVRNVFKEVEEEEEDEDDEEREERYDNFGRSMGGYGDEGGDEEYDLEDSLEESYEDDEGDEDDDTLGYNDDDTFAIRRAEAKLGLNDIEDGGGEGQQEAKTLFHRRAERRAEAKEGGSVGHIVTPRVFIDKNNGFESPRDEAKEVQGEYAGLSDAVSPSARIEDRVQGLRRRCEDGLGVQVFKEAYEFLKRLQERGGVNGNIKTAGGEVTMTPGGTVEGDEEEDDEEAVLEELTNILGEDKLHFWSLVDQLLFCEDLRRGK